MRWLHRPQHENSTRTPILGLFGGSVCAEDGQMRGHRKEQKKSSNNKRKKCGPVFSPSVKVRRACPEINLFVYMRAELTPGAKS